VLDCLYPREGGRGLRGCPWSSSVFVLHGLLLLRRLVVVQHLAHLFYQVQARFHVQFGLGQPRDQLQSCARSLLFADVLVWSCSGNEPTSSRCSIRSMAA
jgi:hypothetical protein